MYFTNITNKIYGNVIMNNTIYATTVIYYYFKFTWELKIRAFTYRHVRRNVISGRRPQDKARLLFPY